MEPGLSSRERFGFAGDPPTTSGFVIVPAAAPRRENDYEF